MDGLRTSVRAYLMVYKTYIPRENINTSAHMVHTYIYIYVYAQLHIDVYIHIYIYVCACVHLFLYTFLCNMFLVSGVCVFVPACALVIRRGTSSDHALTSSYWPGQGRESGSRQVEACYESEPKRKLEVVRRRI